MGFRDSNEAEVWEACMTCGPTKNKRCISWSSPLCRVLKFNVDGATRGKPGEAGIGVVLHDDKGRSCACSLKGVGLGVLMKTKSWPF